MSKNNENKLVPKLRFPEFINERWEKKTIDETCEVLNNLRKPLTSNLREKGEFPYYGASGIIDYVKDFIFNERLLLIGEDGAKWGAYEKTAFIAEGKYWVNNHAHVLKPTGVVDTLLENYLVKLDINPFITGAAPPKLTLGKLKSIPVPIPNSKNEQQKIAACLSSLDEVITAESQKLEVLKDHKKGLLQNLLPQAGETVPKFRFKEFEDSGEWVERTIEEVAKVTTGNKDTQNKVDDGEFPFFVRSQNVERINSYSYDGEAILTSGDGVGVGKNFHYIVGKFDFHQRVYCIYDFEKEVSGRFVYMYFSQHFYERVMRMSAKNSVDSVRRAMITEMPILLPSKKEQEKIADTLSSIDDLIIAQNQKLEALQLHKKGLLQGLFPSINNEE
jgi:type I restriction enzyme S subunit